MARTVEVFTAEGWTILPTHRAGLRKAGDVWRFSDERSRIFVEFENGGIRAYDTVEPMGIGDGVPS